MTHSYGRDVERDVAHYFTRLQQVVARVAHGDFAAGQHTPGYLREGQLIRIGDFATGMRRLPDWR